MLPKVVLLSALIAVSGHTSERKTYDANALGLLNSVFNFCPIEFIQAMKGATRVVSATHVSDRTGEAFVINTVHDNPEPSGVVSPIAKLKIVRTVIQEGGPQGGDKPTQWKTVCELTSAPQ